MNSIEMLKPSKRKRQKRRDKRLHEELIECYRVKSWSGKTDKGYKKKKVGKEFQYSPKQEGIKVRSGGGKIQTDNLSPLIRFLEKNTGKFWDKLYSDLCRKMNKDTLLGQHLFDHLFDFVETSAFKKDGRIMIINRWGLEEELTPGWWYPTFYVHPKSGVLMKVKKRKRK